MPDWNELRAPAAEQFKKLSPEGNFAATALAFLDEWLSKPIYAPQREAILEHVTAARFALLLDCFYQLVPFGTGGRRGRVGFGPNRINQITVGMSVQGHCEFLRKTSPSPKSRRIVVAFDTRCFSDLAAAYSFLTCENPLLGVTSRSLARIAGEIYAANGYEVYMPGLRSEKEYLSTPELSFAIRRLGALGGMNVSASHNPPDDNGFKFFNEHGAQDIPPTDQLMESFMGAVEKLSRVDFDAAIEDRLIRALPDDLHQAYLATNVALRSREARPVTIVYTPLCGTGDGTVGDVLRAAGYDVRLFDAHANQDGSFAAVPLRMPNPEVPEAASPALGMAREIDADLVFSTDPDADRLGVFARDAEGRWRYLNGNEIASLLAHYLALDERGPRRKGVIVKTLVTTRTLSRIAEQAGCTIVADLLVGFKYVANVLLSLERDGHFDGVAARPEDLVLAGEESHGVLLTPLIRDKDAAGGALVLAELAAQLRAEGRRLPEYLDALSARCGNHQNVGRSMVMRGIRGARLLGGMMRSLRENTPQSFDGRPVVRFRDFLSAEHGPLRSDTERLSRNLLAFDLEMAQIVVRPSGTEPKVKIYVDVEGARLPSGRDRGEARRFALGLAARVVEDCIARIGFRLSASANSLPDYVDLDLKADFDTSFRADLAAAAGELESRDEAGQLQWLRERLHAYGGGADPMGPAAGALNNLFDELAQADPARNDLFRRMQRAVASARTPVDWVT
ncbi:MAG: phospho-sugar mutase [Bryobacteraceae bacterium]